MNTEKTKYMTTRNVKKEVRDNTTLKYLNEININIAWRNYEIFKHNY